VHHCVPQRHVHFGVSFFIELAGNVVPSVW